MATVGSGKYTYEYIPDWAKLPAGQELGTCSAVATDSQDRVYVFQRRSPPVLVFDRDGNFLNSWGEGVLTDAHGMFIDGDDNLYIYTDVGFGIADSPFSVTGHLGYTDGALAPPLLAGAADDTGLDWSLGVAVSQGNFEVGVAYIGVEGPSVNDFTDDAIVGTISASF